MLSNWTSSSIFNLWNFSVVSVRFEDAYSVIHKYVVLFTTENLFGQQQDYDIKSYKQ